MYSNQVPADPIGRAGRLRSVAVRLLGLRVRIPPGHGCPSLVSVVCCQVEVSATGPIPRAREFCQVWFVWMLSWSFDEEVDLAQYRLFCYKKRSSFYNDSSCVRDWQGTSRFQKLCVREFYPDCDSGWFIRVQCLTVAIVGGVFVVAIILNVDSCLLVLILSLVLQHTNPTHQHVHTVFFGEIVRSL